MAAHRTGLSMFAHNWDIVSRIAKYNPSKFYKLADPPYFKSHGHLSTHICAHDDFQVDRGAKVRVEQDSGQIGQRSALWSQNRYEETNEIFIPEWDRFGLDFAFCKVHAFSSVL